MKNDRSLEHERWNCKYRGVGKITGPVASALGVIAVVITGLGIAFSESGSAMRKILFVVFGLSTLFHKFGDVS